MEPAGAHPCECLWHSAGVFTKRFPHNHLFGSFLGSPGSSLERFIAPSPLLASSQWLPGESIWCPARFPVSSTHTWQLDSFLANFPSTHLSVLISFLGKKKITACPSGLQILFSPPSCHQCSRRRFLACPPQLVQPMDRGSALIIHNSEDVCLSPISSNEIWIPGLRRVISFKICLPRVLYLSSRWFFVIFFYSLLVVSALEIGHDSSIFLCGFCLWLDLKWYRIGTISRLRR